jgi:transcriptional regulatory protein LEU3
MAAALEDADGVSHHLVTQLEDEFSAVQRQMSAGNAAFDSFTLLMGTLEAQAYFFMPLPNFSMDIFKANMMRCYSTARALIQQALLLEADMAFLFHAPHYVFRAILLAGCIIITIRTCSYNNDLTNNDMETLLEDLKVAMRKFSVQDADLPVRATMMFESYWNIRKIGVRRDLDELSARNFSHRLGASLLFDCLKRWMLYIAEAPKTAAVNRVDGPQEVSGSTGT